MHPFNLSGKDCGQYLERHFAPEPRVFGKVDFSHPARGQTLQNLVVPQRLADIRD